MCFKKKSYIHIIYFILYVHTVGGPRAFAVVNHTFIFLWRYQLFFGGPRRRLSNPALFFSRKVIKGAPWPFRGGRENFEKSKFEIWWRKRAEHPAHIYMNITFFVWGRFFPFVRCLIVWVNVIINKFRVIYEIKA